MRLSVDLYSWLLHRAAYVITNLLIVRCTAPLPAVSHVVFRLSIVVVYYRMPARIFVGTGLYHVSLQPRPSTQLPAHAKFRSYYWPLTRLNSFGGDVWQMELERCLFSYCQPTSWRDRCVRPHSNAKAVIVKKPSNRPTILVAKFQFWQQGF